MNQHRGTKYHSAPYAKDAGAGVIYLARSLAKGLFALHVARHGRKGRHFVMLRIGQDQRGEVIEVLRLLHDAMDLPRHVPPMDEST